MGSERLHSSVLSDEFDYGRDKIIPTCGLEVVACSRRDEYTLMVVRIDKVIIKGCRIKMRPKEDVNVWV
ncbi:hypothetical protein DEO72_LG10g2665 [Vigna unguiculata]|uniref:Uncharacterized protein n=1 Tax=Vigna unguiculata TaxID=3917 RepID=A0A4D6NET7_VIGUN|nr:hypothetical protein DEO72_LG10g2665 [Vigna unguiculata]